jgi:hypothetical protein
MARHDVDPVLQQLVRAVNESGQAAVPVTISVHGTVLTGNLIAQSRYFSELVEGNPLMSALEPGSGLLGKEYAKEAEAESGHHLHVRQQVSAATARLPKACGVSAWGQSTAGPCALSPTWMRRKTGDRLRACSVLRNRPHTQAPGTPAPGVPGSNEICRRFIHRQRIIIVPLRAYRRIGALPVTAIGGDLGRASRAGR